MKKTAFIIIYFISLISFAQLDSDDLLDKILLDLSVDKTDCRKDLIITKSISESESIFVIPEIEEKGEGYQILNKHILIVDKKSGSVKSKFFEEKSWISDAVRLNNINIEYQPYNIFDNSETIGILVTYYGSSRVNPYESKELSLFYRDRNELKRVLKNYSVYRVNGETDGINSGEFETSKKTISSVKKEGIDFYNLKIIDSIIKMKSNEGNQNITDKSSKVKILEYKNGTYQ